MAGQLGIRIALEDENQAPTYAVWMPLEVTDRLAVDLRCAVLNAAHELLASIARDISNTDQS